jgi:hypothetical protein
MSDLTIIIIAAIFAVLSAGFVIMCDRLMGRH